MTKIATAASVSGGGTAIYFGLTPGEWQVIGIIGGLVVGFVSLLIQAALSWWFKSQHLALAREHRKADPEE